jgi:ferredoxin
MPWINEEMCTGCGICVDECCVDAISLAEGKAAIDDGICIRCGVCHGVCPVDAVRHDGEKVPAIIGSNLEWATGLIEHEYYAGNEELQLDLIRRLKGFFNAKAKAMKGTVERLEELRAERYGD